MAPIYRTPEEIEEAARRVAIYEVRFLEILDEHGIDVEARPLLHVSLFDRLPPVVGFAGCDPYSRCDTCDTPRRRMTNGVGRGKLECPECDRSAKKSWRRRQATG